MPQIEIRLRPDGTIEALTHGLKGKACLPYIETIEDLTGAKTVKSRYTDEYWQRDNVVAPPPEDQIDIGGS
ncbi:MAG TPA: DUF2997 domain-containing protein [Conexibacter sp.]|jgi:hypothetical protein